MRDKIPKSLLRSVHRKKLWADIKPIVKKIEKVLPISSIHVIGSFTSQKRRPADIDFVVMLKTRDNNNAKWSFDLLITPDNKYGEHMFNDCKQWMKQKYGSKKSAVLQLK